MLDALPIMLGLIVVVIAAVAAYASTRPDTFRIVRSATIAAPPARIFAIITDFREWPKWSPWQKLDPAMTQTLSGSPSGRGAVQEWTGNAKAGAGRTEITGVVENERVTLQLDMIRPMRARNEVIYTLEPVAGGTRMTWAMTGTQSLPAKVFATVVDFDRLVGKDFEAGLENLKKLVEGRR
jgi:uncharacterized protein YndB with AHSA1/START domain